MLLYIIEKKKGVYLKDFLDSFDVVVIGAGHAGIEAAHAAARLGVKVGLFTLTLDGVGNMPCNPAIGGAAKSQLVREIDALGGEMGIVADKTAIQVRMLGMSKGAAVRALRVQTDRLAYHSLMKKRLEQNENIALKQAEVVEILTKKGAVVGIKTRTGSCYAAKSVVIATGTYLGGKIFVGATNYPSGPDGHHAAIQLSKNLEKLGITLRRFKTGTPARVLRQSIDLASLEEQHGEEQPYTFSYMTKKPLKNHCHCHIAYTDEKGHDILRGNLHRSPLFCKDIVGTGPRYCPSIEDKVVRFADKKRHQMFVEPCGLDTDEMYLQGMSSSMPEDVQLEFYRSIKGFEQVEIMRFAYAIEYDCCDSLQLTSGLRFKHIAGLFGAGQFNGTSGYEEAAAQGLIAGMNAARSALGQTQIHLSRTDSYIGSLIDDLVTRGTDEPYRMMTARSEYRLFLRQDNADARLCPLAKELGILQKDRVRAYNKREKESKKLFVLLKKSRIKPDEINGLLVDRNSDPITTTTAATELLRRPQVLLADILDILEVTGYEFSVIQYVETEIKYEGYLERQRRNIEQQRRDERLIIPEGFDYSHVTHLSAEAREKLTAVRPSNIASAARISGVNPADITVLIIAIKREYQNIERTGL